MNEHNRKQRIEKLKRLIFDKKALMETYLSLFKTEKDYLRYAISRNQAGKGRTLNTAKIKKTLSWYELKYRGYKKLKADLEKELYLLEKGGKTNVSKTKKSK